MNKLDTLSIIILCLVLAIILIAFIIFFILSRRKKYTAEKSTVVSKQELLQMNEAFPSNMECVTAPYKVRKRMLPLSLVAAYFADCDDIVNLETLKKRGIVHPKVNKIGIYGYAEHVPALFVETNYIDIYALECIENAGGVVKLKKMQ